MLHKLVHTSDNYALALVRVALGVVFFAHGSQKALGWFGGPGFDGIMNAFTHQMGIPAPLAVLAILAEFLGAIGLLLGLLSRIAGFGIGMVMVVAVALVHLHVGFFMNWAGTQHGEGFEFHILALAMALMIMARGAGAFSLDRVIDRKLAGSVHHLRVHPAPLHG